MRVVGLISGGKDSCYNLLQCIAAGHEIVALANLSPKDAEEIDSYMYQSVGHSGVQLYAEALDLPLYRRLIEGSSLNIANIQYTPTVGDEVEDLYLLLKQVKEECNVDAVSVGAVLSDYQRVRVENVCTRLGLTCLAYLWQRSQSELLEEMTAAGVHSIIIKVAAVGLHPSKHLGKSIAEMNSYLHKMKDKYNVNVCGEGGEYETFTLDCPIFKKRIVVDEIEVKELTGDVGYIIFKSLSVIDKDLNNKSWYDLVIDAGVKKPIEYLQDLILPEEEQQYEDQAKENYSDCEDEKVKLANSMEEISDQMKTSTESIVCEEHELPVYVVTAPSGYSWATSVKGSTAKEAIDLLQQSLEKDEVYLRHVVSVNMYIADMNDYKAFNSDYMKYFEENPPTRACIEVPLMGCRIQLDVTAWRECHVVHTEENDEDDIPVYRPQRKTMHVQSISHWAPANIGPYSQAVKVGHVVHVAGMIPLIPGTMELHHGGIELQARLSLRHVSRSINAICPPADIRAVVQGVCYVTMLSDISIARRMMSRLTESQIILYLVVPQLPRDALIEWHTWAHKENSSFHYEEKGYTRGHVAIRLKKRSSHDNVVCAIITTVSCKEPSTISFCIVKELVEYSLGKLDIADINSGCSSITFYFKKDKMSRSLIQQALSVIEDSKLKTALSIVPVKALEDKDTLLSLYATKH